ncbi:DUF2691 family protein [Bacillus sp. 03113]|uniref:DUF2691 family protein n=1 Tax=Bacillus sp. 03113 TaxID=2578211 RepID=UPI0037C025AC
MKRGINFEIPNEYGTFLGDALKPIDLSDFNWLIGDGESYITVNDQLDEELFLENQLFFEGDLLKKRIETNLYYVISADLKAYPKDTNVYDIETYEQFIHSECHLVLLIADCCFTTIYIKDKEALELLFNNAIHCGFKNIQYITR